MERVKQTTMVTNEEVLKRVLELRTLLQIIQMRKGNWLDHVTSGKGLLKTVLEGSMEGKKKRGSRRKKKIDDLKDSGG